MFKCKFVTVNIYNLGLNSDCLKSQYYQIKLGEVTALLKWAEFDLWRV